MQALKANKKSRKSQSIIGGSSDRTGVSLGVPDESTVIPASSSEGTGTKPGVPDEEREDDDDDEKIEWVGTDEEDKKNADDDDKSIDLKKQTIKKLKINLCMRKEMTNAKDAETENGDEEINEAAKADADKTNEAKDDIKEAEFPPLSSSLSLSSVLTPIPETPSVALTTTLLPPSSVSTIPLVPLHSTIPILTPPITTKAPSVTIILDPLHVVIQRV
nr:hypothetical protein [Tanacetum cinerariifolium]